MYETHDLITDKCGDKIYVLLYAEMKKRSSFQLDLVRRRLAYGCTQKILDCIKSNTDIDIKNELFRIGIKEEGNGKITSYINKIVAGREKKSGVGTVLISSIESIKGQEGRQCLFILTPDLAKYLFKKNTKDNKMKNLLYVALTRSLETLTIYVTKKVEDGYSRDAIHGFFEKYGACIHEGDI